MKLIDKDNNRITPLGIAVLGGGGAVLFVLIMKLLVLKFAIWFVL